MVDVAIQIPKDTLDYMRTVNIICKTIMEEEVGLLVLKKFSTRTFLFNECNWKMFWSTRGTFLVLNKWLLIKELSQQSIT